MNERLQKDPPPAQAADCPAVVCLSGNVAVGKSTLGERLATTLGAAWIPETTLSMQFPHLLSDTRPESKVIAEITFAALRTAVILSTLLAGDKCLVVERSLWEDRLFYELWRDQQRLHAYDSFMTELFQTLESHPLKFRLYTVLLECPVKLLVKRLAKRKLPYDHLFSAATLEDLQRRYDAALNIQPGRVFQTIDVSNLDISNEAQVERLISSLADALARQWRSEEALHTT